MSSPSNPSEREPLAISTTPVSHSSPLPDRTSPGAGAATSSAALTSIATQPHEGHRSRSIRTDLVLSQLILLSLLVLVYGGSIYWLVRQATHRQVEADLLGAAQLLSQDLQKHDQLSSLRIARTYRHRFGPAPRDHAYFAVWDRDGEYIGGTMPHPPFAAPVKDPSSLTGPRPYLTRMHGPYAEIVVTGPRGEQVLVGRPMAKENDELRRLLIGVTTFGVVALAVGVAGAWWLARRICLPLERITSTAEQISSRRLNQRLNSPATSSEVGRLSRVINTMLDRLQQAFERQVRFTADASHELRTPVAVILTQAEHTLSRLRSSADYRSALETCVTAAGRMKQLIDGLMLLARSDMGQLELRQISLDLGEIVKEVVTLLEPLAVERSIQLTTDWQPARVYGDPLRLNQVATNLITNAIRYNRPNGTVNVSVFPKDDQAWLVVSDSGIGISEADHPHMLEPFFRSDRARTFDDNQGTGLGLSIASEIISAHGGTLEIQSQPDCGTQVVARFPRQA